MRPVTTVTTVPTVPTKSILPTVPRKPPTTKPLELPDTCVGRALAALTPAQRIGQLIMIGVPIDQPAADIDVLERVPVGGVFLQGHSSVDSSQIAGQISRVQKTAGKVSGAPLLVSADQEGGQVQSLGDPDFPPIPDAEQQGRQRTSDLAQQTRNWAKLLVDIGVTIDLAPVADTVPEGTAAQNPPIGAFSRQYGSDPSEVAESITTVVTAMQAEGLDATVKHFPGLGRVRANTDTSADAVDDEATMDDPYLKPFKAAIDAGAAAVMISSANYPKLDATAPAVFSRTIISGLLRGKLGFRGLVMTDDIGNAVAVSAFSPGERATKFIDAGGDLILSVNFADLEPMTAALTGRAKADPAFAAKVDAAALHVLAGKELAGCA